MGALGPPLLLLHGFPQTHLMWRSVAPLLAPNFTVVCADLRGYGRRGCPISAPNRAPYAKRAMAQDMVSVMEQLGFPRFLVVGHDRGDLGAAGIRGALSGAAGIGHDAGLPGELNSTPWTVATNPSDPRLIFVCSNLGQIFRSSDGGESWTRLKREFGEVRATIWQPL